MAFAPAIDSVANSTSEVTVLIFQRLATEIRRRKVLRVVAVYAVTAWIVLQVGVVISEPLNFPAWTMRALIVAAIVGFPVSFVLAWVIDIRPEGLIFDVPLFGGAVEREQRKSDLVLALLLVVLLSVSAYYLIVRLLSEVESNTDVSIESIGSIAPNSIAVLPFDSLSKSEEANYFTAGLTEEIIITLSSLKELKVASRNSSFQFQDETLNVENVAAQLAVANILYGSARQFAGKVIVNSYLTKTTGDYVEWSDRYERPIDDIFAIQQDIASSIVGELKLVLSPDSKATLKKQVTSSSEAYVSYLEGVGRLRSSSDVDVMIEAKQLFSAAVARDPSFARAYAGICEVYLRIYEKSNSKVDFDEAESACKQAEKLDSSLSSEIGLALGKLYLFQGRYDQSEKQLIRALEVSNDPTDIYIELGELRNRQGKVKEAEKILLKAANSRTGYWAAEEALAVHYHLDKRYEDALIRYKNAAELAPSVATVYGGMGLSYWMLGDFEQAINAYEKSLAIKESRLAYTNLGLLYYYKKDFEKAIHSQKSALMFAPDDHRVWGRLGEAYYFASMRSEARESFARAAELAESNLEINDQDIKTIRLLAVYYAQLGRIEQANTMVKRAIELTPRHSESHYTAAQVYVLFGDNGQAIDALIKTLEFNERYAVMIGRTPYFTELRAQSRLKAILLPYQNR